MTEETPETRRLWSIGTKLSIVFLALAIIPMSVTVYYNLSESQEEVSTIARENLVELSRGTAHRIGHLLVENQRDSATLAGEPVVVEFLSATERGRQTLAPDIRKTLKNFADNHPDYDSPALAGADGIIVASPDDGLAGRNIANKEYFKTAIDGEPHISEILLGRTTGRPGVYLTNPVRESEGRIVGADVVWLNGDIIRDIIDDTVLGDEGIAYLVDQKGVIIAHPNRSLLYHRLGEITPKAEGVISSALEGSGKTQAPKSLGMDDLAVEVVSGRSGTYRYYSTQDGRHHVVGYTRLREHPWTVVVDLPESQFLAPLQWLASVAWLSVVFVGVLTLIVSILLARSITHPIRHLTEAAAAIEHEQPFTPADIEDVTSGRDEIAHLGRVFNSMMAALKQREEKLRESEEKHRTAVTNAPLILFTIDNNGVITLAEGRGLDVIGLRPDEVIGLSALDIPPEMPAIFSSVERALEGETFTTIEDWGDRVFEVRYSPHKKRDGEVAGTIGVAVDVTGRGKKTRKQK